MFNSLRRGVAAFIVMASATSGLAWDAAAHRAITIAAMKGLPDSCPAWLKDRSTMDQVSDQATVPDRWRSTRVAQLTHLNNPDHYIDLEDLEPYGLTLDTLPILRYEYVKALVLAKERAGSSFTGRPPDNRDLAKIAEYPGFLPYAMMEQYAKIQSAFKTVQILEKLNDPARDAQLKMARANAMYNMGILSHFVGDASQPLHTTKHHHGWEGDNPFGYTTDRGIHSYIDGAIVRHHSITAADVSEAAVFDLRINPNDPWKDVTAHIASSFAQVERLYQMKKTGELERGAGKVFILERLASSARVLEAMYQGAWESAEPDERDMEDFVKFDNFGK
jgi:hypothetical protein